VQQRFERRPQRLDPSRDVGHGRRQALRLFDQGAQLRRVDQKSIRLLRIVRVPKVTHRFRIISILDFWQWRLRGARHDGAVGLEARARRITRSSASRGEISDF